MQRPETNDGQQLQGGVLGLVATVMLTNVGADDHVYRRDEPINPGMTEPDCSTQKKPSQRL